jgi:hypothetical protein
VVRVIRAHHCLICRTITKQTAEGVLARALTVEASKLYFRLRMVALADEALREDG